MIDKRRKAAPGRQPGKQTCLTTRIYVIFRNPGPKVEQFSSTRKVEDP